MNNLNDPQDWNIRPERQGDGGGDSRWNYALLMPMLGLAAFRWIWSKQFQKQIEEAKVMIRKELANQNEQIEEAKIKFQNNLAYQKEQLEKERSNIRLECEAVNYQTSVLFHNTLETEKEQEGRALRLLEDVEYRLVKRQEMFCSKMVHSSWRVVMEKELLAYIAKEPLLADLKMENGLKDIFQNDSHCAEIHNTNPRKNGCLMWLYLSYWKLQLSLQSHKKAEAAVLNTQTKK
uniref:Coiled-coil domain containing 127b n=1 Tax=Cyprinus carpio TaxID=7962 RepID=A0A8C2FWS6_CYPCA